MLMMFTNRVTPARHITDIDCLQPVNYDRLNFSKKIASEPQVTRVHNPDTLEALCCRKICTSGYAACEHSIKTCPSHLAPLLLRSAIDMAESNAIVPFIGSWPMETLCFRDVLSESRKDVLEEEMFIDLLIFKGVSARTKRCQMKCMDLRGLELNQTFTKLIINMWPMLALKKCNRNVKKLTNIVLKQAVLKKDNRLSKEIIPKLINDMLSHERILQLHSKYAIDIPRGKKLVVLIDKLEFTTQSTFFMDYLITHCLQKVTPLTVQVANISIRSELNVGDEILDSLAPFIIFRGQDVKTLQGIWLANLEDNVFFLVQKDLTPFKNLTALGLPNCNVALREGRTRCRTRTRTLFAETLASFQHLVKLDLTENSFAGCLSELLGALHLPLEYLKLKDCDLFDVDMEYLAHSRHAKSLKFLNISRICGLFPDDEFAVTSTCLVRNLKHFTNLRVIHMQQNHIGDTLCTDLCNTIKDHWPLTKAINLADNVLTRDACFEVARACAQAPHVQYVKLPHAHNLMSQNEQQNDRRSYLNSLEAIVKNHCKPHIQIEVLSIAFAFLGNF